MAKGILGLFIYSLGLVVALLTGEDVFAVVAIAGAMLNVYALSERKD